MHQSAGRTATAPGGDRGIGRDKRGQGRPQGGDHERVRGYVLAIDRSGRSLSGPLRAIPSATPKPLHEAVPQGCWNPVPWIDGMYEIPAGDAGDREMPSERYARCGLSGN